MNARIANEGTSLYSVWRGSRAIGASAAAAVLGRDRYQTPQELWAYVTRRMDKPPQTAAMLEGLEAEPELTAIYESQRDQEGEPVNLLDAEHDFLRAQIDWLSYDQTRAAEYKFTRSRPTWELSCEGKLAPFWEPAAQHKLMILGFEEIDWFVATPHDTPEAKFDVTAFVVKRDEAFIKAYREQAVKFWNDYIVADVEPPYKRLRLVLDKEKPHAL